MTTQAPRSSRAANANLSDLEFWRRSSDSRHSAYKALRHAEGLSWFEPRSFSKLPFPSGGGYYAVTRYADVRQVDRTPNDFISGKGASIGDMPSEMTEYLGSLLYMDGERHSLVRSIVSSGFTPTAISGLMHDIETRVEAIIDRALEMFPESRCDLVEHLAAPLPLEVICAMMGVPQSDADQVRVWTEEIVGLGDAESSGDFSTLMATALQFFQYAQSLAEERRARPRDDIATLLVQSSIDGRHLTAQEFGSFFILLVVAGNETVRNAISHGIIALTENPVQRELLFNDFERYQATAVEEIVRWATPVIQVERQATRDVVLGGTQLRSGDNVVLFYESANFDETVFDNPLSFLVGRASRPPHVGFGAGGPHFCLGANLARRELAVFLDAVRRRLPGLRAVGQPEYTASMFVHGVKRVLCEWG